MLEIELKKFSDRDCLDSLVGEIGFVLQRVRRVEMGAFWIRKWEKALQRPFSFWGDFEDSAWRGAQGRR